MIKTSIYTILKALIKKVFFKMLIYVFEKFDWLRQYFLGDKSCAFLKSKNEIKVKIILVKSKLTPYLHSLIIIFKIF